MRKYRMPFHVFIKWFRSEVGYQRYLDNCRIDTPSGSVRQLAHSAFELGRRYERDRAKRQSV